MTNTETERAPNPLDFTNATGAAVLLGRSRATVYDMVTRKVITPYRLFGGTVTVYWVPELRHVANALRTLEGTRDALPGESALAGFVRHE